MRPRPPIQGRGIFNGTGIIIACLAATLVALVLPFWSYEDRSGTDADVLNAETVATLYGPLSGLDREFLTKVRLAGLWELPAGRQAQAQGTTEAVRTAGRHLVEGHTFLDERVRTVAGQLGLALPNEPDDQQKAWLEQLDAARGVDYDRKFANILRLAHGRVFSVVAQVRASTRNALVRGLADDANATVLDHIQILEATGYVDFDALARDMAATQAAPAAPTTAAPGPAAGPGEVVPLTP
jgi:predicted outer membrane protein